MGQAKRRGDVETRRARLWAEFGLRPMTMERYNAFIAWTRSPAFAFMGEELEFFSSLEEHVIGVIVKDSTDSDFGYIAMGRDEKGRFRCVDVLMSLTLTEARHGLFKSIKSLVDTGKTVFPQGEAEGDKAGVDLFEKLVAEDSLSPHFKLLRDNGTWLPAKSIMCEMMRHFMDVDGNFVEQFQSTGFDSRIWELYLYAALLELGLFISKPEPAPDFKVELGGNTVFIEAVTVGPTVGDPPIQPDGAPHHRNHEELIRLLKTKIPIKFGSALYNKLSRKKPYWEMDDVKGHPLIFAIADFHEAQSMTWTSPALLEYLYGVTHDFHKDEDGKLIISPLKIETHEFEGKKIPSGFFLQPNSEHVSAILFTSSGTLSKFNRMGRLAGFGLGDRIMLRSGLRHNHDQNAILPESFMHQVQQGAVKESWAEGLSLFHNPSAAYPVDLNLFPGIAHHFFNDGQIESILPDVHIYSSMTWNFTLRAGERDAVDLSESRSHAERPSSHE